MKMNYRFVFFDLIPQNFYNKTYLLLSLLKSLYITKLHIMNYMYYSAVSVHDAIVMLYMYQDTGDWGPM